MTDASGYHDWYDTGMRSGRASPATQVPILELGKGWNWLPGAFAALFLAATVSRMFSAYFLTLQIAALFALVRLPARAAKPRPTFPPSVAMPRGLEVPQRPFGVRVDVPHILPGGPPVSIPSLLGREKAGAKHSEPVLSGAETSLDERVW